MFWPWGGHLTYNLTNLPNLLIIFPSFFHNALKMTCTTTSFNCRYPSMWCTHPINPMGIHLLHNIHGNNRTWIRMMQFVTLLLPFCKMLASTWDDNNYMRLFQPCSIPLVDESTLCSLKMEFAPWLTLSLLTQHKHIHSPVLCNSRICYLWCGLSQKKELSQPTPQ
jgi:hypothetical protein